MHIFETQTNQYRIASIKIAKLKEIPLKKDGWKFNWKVASKKTYSMVYVLKLKDAESNIAQGMLQLVNRDGMLSMDLIEIHPKNIGENRVFDLVAGCLIAFGCRESLKLENSYQGYLTFESKTALVKMYKEKYGATQTLGNKMYISPEIGIKLIEKYLENKLS